MFCFCGVSFFVVVVVLLVTADYFCGYPTPQIKDQSPLLCLVICGITSSVKQAILPMSELARNARKYSNLSADFINQPSLLMMKYGMESHIQQIQRKKASAGTSLLLNFMIFLLAQELKGTSWGFFFPLQWL